MFFIHIHTMYTACTVYTVPMLPWLQGIPYAAAPVGDLRWKPPQDVASHEDCWNDMPFHAREFGAICSQYNETSQQMEGAEDCLYINVWTSQLHPDNPMEVMVYIHGGGLMRGSGNEWRMYTTST